MKKLIFLILCVGLFSSTCYSQENVEQTAARATTPAKANPQFPGGQKAFNEYLIKELGPTGFVKDLEGKIIVTFTVEKDGTLTNIQIKQGIEKELNIAVLQALCKSPKWIPGYYEGKPVRVQYSLPITF